ncbi:hypothetical protein L249_5676 [Ophiocordyceps polyrhachis-furcata BCC 54312]|uniref:Carrier domain-containing protein n=1 Tax=Ophiocordyceps polyrhachis-furcata BCC 54312 TaxID=1330021 RepID=A0A367KZV2_9HYPO|nr:hypothetical protein L249_5676 [Ophiocordyceps polyrhachis-furcata BCC 54312]
MGSSPAQLTKGLPALSQQDPDGVLAEPIEACVHSLIKRHVVERPSAPALCSRDGELGYGQIDVLSSRLARQLALVPASTVVLCFEKSLIAPVVALAVFKAGAVAVALDLDQPLDRLRAIVGRLSDPVFLSSSANASLARQLAPGPVVVLDPDTLSAPVSEANAGLPPVSPSDTLCLVFLSDDLHGLTGATVSHRDMSSAIVYQQRKLGYAADCRTLDAAPPGSYTAWCNMLHTLASGGCLCIPSAADDVWSSAAALRANTAHVTPDLARGLLHKSGPAGRLHLTLVGEPLATPESDPDSSTAQTLCSLSDGVRALLDDPPLSHSLGRSVGRLRPEGPLFRPAPDSAEILNSATSLASTWSGCCGWTCSAGDVVTCADGGVVVVRVRPVDGEPKSQARGDSEPSEDSIENMQFTSESEETLDTPEAEQVDSSDMEQLLLPLWAQVLQINPDKISSDDDFFELGGDVAKSMRLHALARQHGFYFSVRDFFRGPSIRQLSARTSQTSAAPAVSPFSLLDKTSLNLDETRAHVAQLCGAQTSQVVDLLPCSPLQEGLLALTQRLPGSYVAQHVYEVDEGVSASRLRRAWDQVVAMNPILRTRVVSLPSQGLVQVVLDQGAPWLSATDLDDYQRRRSGTEQQIGLGTPLSRFAMLDNGAGGARPCFVWEIHHALYDGWSLPLLMAEAEKAYYGEMGQDLQPMTGFIKYIQDGDEMAAKAFWRAQFTGIQEVHFPRPRPAAAGSRSAALLSLTVPNLGWGRSDFTPATMARAAWAVVMARGAGSDEALYGVTVTGRQAPVDGIEHMAGPAIATVPMRVRLDWGDSVYKLLDAVQRQSTDMIPFEQTGLQRIRRMSDEAALACSFGSLMVVQPAAAGGDGEGGDSPTRPFLSKPGGDDDDDDDDQAAREAAPVTYPIEVECHLGTDEARLRVEFNPDAISRREMEAITESFEQVLRKLADRSLAQEKLASLVASHSDRRVQDALGWNATVPEPVEQCVHHIFSSRVHDRPLAPALDAWDGKLTYRELDSRSTTLALRLVARGVSPGMLVPVLFEKSAWMPVAVLAVMKAGGALVAMEVKEPEDRLRTIASQVTSPVLLSSVRNAALARRLTADDMAVEVIGDDARSESADAEPQHALDVLPVVSPSSLLYVVFTSGSTGTPKGVMISHSNFCSAIAYQQQFLDYNQNARVLDFASCAFDVAWSNLFNTLTSGACLCIPSPEERENDLAGCLSKYDISFADLTPSVARALGPDVLSRLTTMILGGEAPLPSDALLSSGKTHIINAYGPAECTPTATLSTLDATDVSIGRGLGVCTWIVDEAESLTPVGDVGELWIEGPLVGQGYLNDPERTAAAFVRDPSWLQRAVGRRGLVYRTGDLVRYREDGALVFIGRKDTQVKIRGQRVELSEVESCVRQLMDATDAQVVAEAIQPAGSGNPILVAFVALPVDDHDEAVRKATEGLSDRLRQVVPSYMVPAAYIPVPEMPVTTAGKTDRRRLRAIGASMWAQYRIATEKKGPSTQPANEIESILQKVWMSVLNLSAEEASVEASFASLGGDSISAMQLVSRCRLHNVMFTVSDILQSNTIRRLASLYKPVASVTGSELLTELEREEEEDPAAEFDLSPMQQSFFRDYPDGLNHFNQSFLLDLGQDVTTQQLMNAMKALVSRHAMLRARFLRDPGSGVWRQRIEDEGPDSFAFAEHTVENRDEVGRIGQKRQGDLDICDGPVFACDLFHVPDGGGGGEGGGQVVLLSAHHLVIDLVSWRILWNDVEEYVKLGELQLQKTLSFRSWCAAQAKVGSSLSPLSVLPYPIPEPELDFWDLPLEENTFGDCDTLDVGLDPDVSKLLFGKSNESLRTEALDLILGALSYSFHQTFPERSVPAIWIEGHGREQLEDNLPTDVSGTIGWFTTMYPLAVPIGADQTVTHAVRLVKDTRRKVPRMGLPFYACQHYSESGRQAFRGHDVYEVVFNFTGRFQQLEREEGLFKSSQTTDESDVKITEISKSARRFLMLEIGAVVADNALAVSFNYHKGMKHQDRLREWSQTFVRVLESAVHLLARAPVGFTLSDLPLLQLSYRGLDSLVMEQLPRMGVKPQSILDIYPCSPLQEGMLLSSVKGAASYITYTIWRCLSTDGAVSAVKLEEAWRKVAGRHTILSTIFALHPEGNGFLQLVLDKPPVRVTHLRCGSGSPAETLSRLPESTFADDEPEHALVICQSDTGEVACRLDMSHALTDAHSSSLLLTELATAYLGNGELTVAPAFADIVRYINSTSRSQIVSTWTSLLDNVKPCEFPLSPVVPDDSIQETFTELSCNASLHISINEFCKKTEVMPSALIQVAWAMVLSHMTGMRDVCFGYLVSGRDAPVDGVENLVGPLANLLISRVNLGASARQVLETTSEGLKQHLSIQHVSLAEIQHHLGLSGRRMFNTSLSIRANDKEKSDTAATGLSFDIQAGGDAHEFDVKCNASIGGADIDLSVEFREPYVSRRVALEARSTLESAIGYLLANTYPDLDIEGLAEAKGETDIDLDAMTLHGGFFKHTTGVHDSDATSFWEAQFAHTQGTHFPQPKPSIQHSVLDDSMDLDIGTLDWQTDEFAVETMVRSAWSVLTARVMCSDESIFGTRVSGNDVMPIRVVVDWDRSVDSLLNQVQGQSTAMKPYGRMGMERVRRVNGDAALASGFQTLLTVLDDDDDDDDEAQGVERRGDDADHVTHSLEMTIRRGKTMMTRVSARFDSRIINQVRVSRIVHQFAHVLQQMLDTNMRQGKLREVTVASKRDLQDVWTWNADVPSPVTGCIHDDIVRNAETHPHAQAVHGWDGSLTYKELEEVSRNLAVRLMKRGVGRGSIVPLCFEKSMWMPVAALAVMRAGGASVAVDTTQPQERIRTMTSTVFAALEGPKVILSSVANEAMVSQLGADEVIVVCRHGLDEVEEAESEAPELPVVSPSDVLYVVFTSGSTGKPKGVVINHQNFYTATHYQRTLLGVKRESRVLDFSSYAFDVAWLSMLKALTAGACLCIASAAERQDDLGGCLIKYGITVVDLTPAVARVIEPREALSSLDTLILGGEAVSAADADLVGDKTQVMVAYGPAECTPTCSIMNLSKTRSHGIGHGVGMCLWVVDLENADGLAPVGVTGELWLEGPLVGMGYLNEPQKTAASFVRDPAWLSRGSPDGKRPGRRGCVYRTGDLVQQLEDGSFLFIGRKDTQVKIRGQRVELGEIEHHVQQTLEESGRVGKVHVAAETIQPRGVAGKMLVAYVAAEGTTKAGADDDEVRQAAAAATDKLAKTLPVYMVPTLYIPIKALPMSATGKIDRRRLQEMGSSLTAKDVAAMSRAGEQRRTPQTEAERTMQSLWAEVLHVEAESIGADDSFFRIGGDSIGAMRLVGLARFRGFEFSVRDVFQSPVLSDLAALEGA